jgi:hypothetical protein
MAAIGRCAGEAIAGGVGAGIINYFLDFLNIVIRFNMSCDVFLPAYEKSLTYSTYCAWL